LGTLLGLPLARVFDFAVFDEIIRSMLLQTMLTHSDFSAPINPIVMMDQDALLDYRMDAPHIPEVKDPNHSSTCEDEVVEGFASNFL
jgi:hypothetical protein